MPFNMIISREKHTISRKLLCLTNCVKCFFSQIVFRHLLLIIIVLQLVFFFFLQKMEKLITILFEKLYISKYLRFMVLDLRHVFLQS